MFLRTVLAIVLFFSFADLTFAGPFDDPKVERVCDAKPKPGTRLPVDVSRLMTFYLRENKVDNDDLKTRLKQTAGTDEHRDAILRPRLYCDTHRCSDETVSQLTRTQVSIVNFLTKPREPIGEGKTGFVIEPLVADASIGAAVPGFLRGLGPVRAYCVAGSSKPTEPEPDPETKKTTDFINSVRIRKSVTDLHLDALDKSGYAGIDMNSNRISKKTTVSSEFTVGIPLQAFQFAYDSKTFLFVTQKSSRGSGVSVNTDTGDAGVGISTDMLFKLFGNYNQLQLYTHYINSYETQAELVTANAVLSPDLPIACVNLLCPVFPSLLSLTVQPQLKFTYGSIIEAGTNTLLQRNTDYARVGPRVGVWLFGEGLLNKFTVTASYEHLETMQGPLASVSKFESALSYLLAENWSLQLKYDNGRDVDTLQRQEAVKLSLGYRQ